MSAWIYEIYINNSLISEVIVSHSVENALIVAKRNYPNQRVKVRTLKDEYGVRPAILATVQELQLTTEQCWASVENADGKEVRCHRTARTNHHTCDLHTTWGAPCFGTKEYDDFMREPLFKREEVTDKQIRKAMREEKRRLKRIDDLYTIKDDKLDLPGITNKANKAKRP